MDVSVGVDIGSTATKVVVLSPPVHVAARHSFRSEWFSDAGAVNPRFLVDQLIAGVASAVQAARASSPEPLRLVGLGITSVAESGILVSDDGEDLTPIIPWYDPRGADLLTSLSSNFQDTFAAVTGLPLSPQWSLVKLLWFQSQGATLDGTWLSLAEYVAYRLTGRRYAEPSLASRTGLLDQDTGRPFEAACRLLGRSPRLLPEMRTAGTGWGSFEPAIAALTGVPVTVAGHDHLVAAYAHGVVAPDEVLNSSGTADALVRIIGKPWAPKRRQELTAAGLTHGHHVVPGRRALLGGTRGGLVLRQVLELLGPDRRDDLDRAAAASALDDGAVGLARRVTVSGARIDATEVTIQLLDDATPLDVWRAAVHHVTAELSAVCERMSAEVGWPENVVGTGGWTQMQSVWAAKQKLFPGIRHTSFADAGAVGAARLGHQAGTYQARHFVRQLVHDCSYVLHVCADHVTVLELTAILTQATC